MSTFKPNRETRIAPVSAGRRNAGTPPSSYPIGVPRQLLYPNLPAWGLLERAARELPHRIAVHLDGREWTYGEVHDATLRLASWLQNQGVGTGRRVAVLLPNCPEYLIAVNAIWRAGGVVVAVSPLSVRGDVSRLLRLTECRMMICLDLLTDLVDSAAIDHKLVVSLRPYLGLFKRWAYSIPLWQRTGKVMLGRDRSTTKFWDAVRGSSGQPIPAEILPDRDPAYILSTGGTTDDPKAVTLSHRNIVANAWQQRAWAGATMGEETLLAVLPFFHSYGMSTLLGSGCALGAKLIVLPRFNPHRTIQAIATHRPTVVHAVPAMLAAMNEHLRASPADLSSIKWVISGGASLPAETAREFADHSGAVVVEGYGLSEASPVTHVGPLDGTNVTGTIGLPLPDTHCRIVDLETGTLDVPDGHVGELVVQGPQVMQGYWRNPSATQQVLREGWLFTGDLASRDARGIYTIADRKKDLIITSGFNVYPAEVEQVLRQCDLVADVGVVGVPDSERGELVKAFVVLRDGARWNLRQLKRFAHHHLAAHRRPRIWEQVQGDLPRNFLGKVIRRQLRTSTTSSGGTS